MGKRRIRLIREMYPDYTIIGIDKKLDRIMEAENRFNIKCLDSIDNIKDVDCAFICTSPLSHSVLIHDCLTKGWHVFTELNLIPDGYQENIALSKKINKTLFLSSTFLYREEIDYIRKMVKLGKNWNYIYHVGQYLPDWHPWESYNDFFLSDKRTNGCREIMAIELPWIIDTFGGVETVNVLSDKISNLNIEYNDNFMIQFEHKNGNKGTVIVDVVSPIAVRKLEVYNEEKYLTWDGTPESIKKFDVCGRKIKSVKLSEQAERMDGYSAFIVENAYKYEIQQFFDVVNGRACAKYSFDKDLEILKLIDKIGA